MSALNTLVSESVDVVVHAARTSDGPRVTSIVAVEDQTGAPDATQFTTTEVFRRGGPGEELRWTGQVPSRLARMLRDAGTEIRSLLDVERAASASHGDLLDRSTP